MAEAAFDEDGDDPVVQEFPVYLSKGLAEHLYIFEHPVRRSTAPYDDTPVVSARVKPKQNMVELEYALDTNLSCYDKSKGEEIALNAVTESGAPFFTGSVMDKQKIVSSIATTMPYRYAVGLFKDGEVHLNPVKNILEFHPSFPHMRQGGIKKGSHTNDAEEAAEEEEEAKPVMVRFAKPETERAKKAREKSFKFLQQRMAEEPWIDVKFNHYKSHPSELQRAMLQCQVPDEEASGFQVTTDDYLRKFIPEVKDAKYVQPNLPKNDVSLAHMRLMPLADQITAIVANARVISFDRLQTLLPHGVEPNAVLRALQQAATLVQGCWVVKSEVLYPKGTSSPHSGVAAEMLCKARDYIMWRFTQSAVLTRKEISSLIKLPSEDLKEMLQQVALSRPKIGWEFRLPKDEIFIKQNPNLVQRQSMIWDSKYQQLSKLFKMPTMKIKEEKDIQVFPKGVRKPRSRQTPECKSDDSDREKSNRASISLSSSGNSVTLQARLLQQLDITVVKQEPIDPKDAEMLSVDISRIRQEQVDPNDVEMLAEDISRIKQEPVDPKDVEMHSSEHLAEGTNGFCNAVEDHQARLKEELTKFVREQFQAIWCLTLIELKERLHSKLAESPPGYILCKGVSDRLLETTIQEVGGVHVNSKWPIGLNDEAIYALPSAGDHLDKFRKSFIELYKTAPRFRKFQIKKKVEDLVGSPMQDGDLNKLIKDYCFSLKQGFFTLKFSKVPNS